MDTNIIFNWLLDLRKKEIEPVERAEIIKKFLVTKGWTQIRLAKELGVPPQTILSWVIWGRMNKKEYNILRKRGYSKSELFHSLNNNRFKELLGEGDGFIRGGCKLDEELRRFNGLVRSCVLRPSYSEVTIDLISDLRNNLNRLESKIERFKK